MSIHPKVETLLKHGVVIPCPASVEVNDGFDPRRVAPGVVIHAGCRILGATTSIGPECVLGQEAPATVEDCQLGRKVALKGGYFCGATFLDGANMGSAAHIRPGTLLEEEASGAHAVGLKQTIFLPFVTAGSLINFCDALIAGGTSRKNHSEIGSSYIHFNYTPHQDKATPSLVGDVPRGVMLDQPAIFLGGQGGLVGPARIGFGSVIPAGLVMREDAPEGERLLYPAARVGTTKPYKAGAYRSIRRVVWNNLVYIGNIRALQAWYRFIRQIFVRDDFERACHEGALSRLDSVLGERIKRLRELAEKMPRSLEIARAESHGATPSWQVEQEKLAKEWPAMADALDKGPAESVGAKNRDRFLEGVESAKGANPIETVRAVSAPARQAGTAWLQAIVDEVSAAGGFHS
ncbi:MAG: UDP-N-acetylglucosamine pyrophosphorylase [Vicinamibacteria bacterium]|nr:UDP-N-acetylglucosamine pyrophosphorylase [Vicinamibacteria bacterium]